MAEDGQRFYREEEAEAILRLASSYVAPEGGISKEKLLDAAAELGISADAVERAELQFTENRTIQSNRKEFDQQNCNDFKRTLFSLLPYTFAFAALPSAAFVAREMAPPLWMVVVGAGFGTIAHFANVLKDLDADRELGINGLPQRIGMKYSVSICVLILIAITPIVATHRPHYGAWAYAALLASLIALIVKPRKLGFAAIMALALVDVLLTAVAHN